MAQNSEWALKLPDAVRQVILKEARGERPDEVLAATGRAGDRLVSYLETLIGAEGARALHQRSITLTRRQHPWLVDGERQEPAVVLQSSVTLLVTFVNLLVSFIGERLTVQMLCQVWPDVAPVLRSKKESS